MTIEDFFGATYRHIALYWDKIRIAAFGGLLVLFVGIVVYLKDPPPIQPQKTETKLYIYFVSDGTNCLEKRSSERPQDIKSYSTKEECESFSF